LRWRQLLRRRPLHRRVVRYSLIGANITILAVVIGFLALSPHTSASEQTAAATVVAGNAANPLDLLSSADVAASVADVANLPEATAVRDQASSVKAELAVAPAEDVVAAKPQVVATALKSRQDIQTYTAQSGDTLASLAAKFDVTSNSILWSNALKTTTVNAGTKLLIPPVTGIVYTVKAGDTPTSLAQKYGANAQAITSFNDAEISGLTPGEQIVIPNGQIQQASLPSYNSNFTATYGNNGYDFGFCTWYVASQIAVPSNWGNASSWAYYSALSGWNVSTTPAVGAIAQTALAAGGQGHVAIVTAVSADGSQLQFKDMNGIAGWDRVGQSGWVSASTYQHYITP
jgi:surface antigen